MKGYCIYRHFDKDENLLYVGATCDLLVRINAHKGMSHWFNEITKITVEHFKTKNKAYAAEKVAIKNESPKFNLYGAGKERKIRKTYPGVFLDESTKLWTACYSNKGEMIYVGGGFKSQKEAFIALEKSKDSVVESRIKKIEMIAAKTRRKFKCK